MRMQLHLQSLQLSLRELGLQLRSAKLAFSKAKVITHGIAHSKRCSINEQVNVKLAQRASEKHVPKRARCSGRPKGRPDLAYISEEGEVSGPNNEASQE